MKKRYLVFTALALALSVGVGIAQSQLATPMGVKAEDAAEVSYKTLTFPDENKANNKCNVYTTKWTAEAADGMTYNVANFNNNNWSSWAYIRCGSKSAASVATISNKVAFEEAVTSVKITIDKITVASVNSIKLYSSATADFSNKSEVENFPKVAGEQTVKISSPAKNLFYQIAFDCQKSSSNGILQLSKVEFMRAGTTATIDAISLEADDDFKDTQLKGCSFDATGLSVSALYSDSSVYDIDLKDVSWYVKAEKTDEAYLPLLDDNGNILTSLDANVYYLYARYGEIYTADEVSIMIDDPTLVSSIEISASKTDIDEGESIALSSVVSPEDATDKSITWHVSDEEVASISNTGVLKGLKTGTVEAYCVSNDGSNIQSNKLTFNVKGYAAKNYTLVNSECVDYSGKYLIGYQANASTIYTWNGVDAASNYYSASVNDGKLVGSKDIDAHYVVIEKMFNTSKVSQGYSVKIVGGANDGKYVNYAGTKNGMGIGTAPAAHQMKLSNAKTGAIEIATAKNLTLRFNNTNGQTRFRFYTSGQQPIQLYRLDASKEIKDKATAFANAFLAKAICGSDDLTPAQASLYDEMETAYNALDVETRAYLANRVDAEGLKAFYAQYDAIQAKRATESSFYDFLAGRYQPASSKSPSMLFSKESGTTWALAGIGLVTIAASCVLVLSRRKKTN